LDQVTVIGGGIAGLAAASTLAVNGKDVDVFEKNDQLGGRLRSFEDSGFRFDMGPSWYWMPDVMERFFSQFGKSVSDYFELIRLDPSYQVFFEDGDCVVLPASYEEIVELFEKYERGSGKQLERFLKDAEYKYQVGVGDFVFRPSLSIAEYMDPRLVKELFRLKLFSSISSEIRARFKNPKLIELLEFPVLFLGAKPNKTPSLYSLMNYADIKLGTWYPVGGMDQLSKAMVTQARSLGVRFHTGQEVKKLKVRSGRIQSIFTQDDRMSTDAVISGADYAHTEMHLLDEEFRSYSEKYWERRVMSPSALIFYLGVKKKVPGLLHHNLFFDSDFTVHAEEIYDTKQWPKDPLFYVCCPSKTDSTVAPEGCENLFVLVPIAAGLTDTEERRMQLFDLVMDRLEQKIGSEIRDDIVFKRSYCLQDFVKDYHSYKGNAYGLANTLMQTAFLKPRMRSKKVSNLYFAGQLTVPGPGVPPSIISGEVAARQLLKDSNAG
jgi:phytoene desaturase